MSTYNSRSKLLAIFYTSAGLESRPAFTLSRGDKHTRLIPAQSAFVNSGQKWRGTMFSEASLGRAYGASVFTRRPHFFAKKK